MKNLYKTQMQWPSRGGFIHNLHAHDPEEGARPDEYGGSLFMTGLLLEPIVKYHRLTGSDIAADSIFRALDWIINEGLGVTGEAVKYMTADNYLNTEGAPINNMLIVHGFGYGYKISGYKQQNYLEVGMRLFNKGVKDAYIGRRKHFNQAHRSSGHFLAYVADGLNENLSADGLGKPANKNVRIRDALFYSENFEEALGKFKSDGDAALEIDKEIVYLNGSSLKVKSKYSLSALSAGVELEDWDINKYYGLHFAYLIPKGVPVGMRVKTNLGDWICIGGSPAYKCKGSDTPKRIYLKDDGLWHEISIDVKFSVQSVLSRIDKLSGFQFYTNANANRDDEFWIDDFRIIGE